MSDQGKKRQSIYDLLNARTNLKFLCLLYTKNKTKKNSEKELLEEKEEWTSEQKKKKREPF